jgi:hypothetical protein
MTEEKKEQPKNVAVDLECDDEFEEFGNEGASRVPARVEISTRSVPEISSGSPHPSPFLTDPDPANVSDRQSGAPRKRTRRMSSSGRRTGTTPTRTTTSLAS